MATCPRCEQPIQHLTVMPLDGRISQARSSFMPSVTCARTAELSLGPGETLSKMLMSLAREWPMKLSQPSRASAIV